MLKSITGNLMQRLYQQGDILAYVNYKLREIESEGVEAIDSKEARGYAMALYEVMPDLLVSTLSVANGYCYLNEDGRLYPNPAVGHMSDAPTMVPTLDTFQHTRDALFMCQRAMNPEYPLRVVGWELYFRQFHYYARKALVSMGALKDLIFPHGNIGFYVIVRSHGPSAVYAGLSNQAPIWSSQFPTRAFLFPNKESAKHVLSCLNTVEPSVPKEVILFSDLVKAGQLDSPHILRQWLLGKYPSDPEETCLQIPTIEYKVQDFVARYVKGENF